MKSRCAAFLLLVLLSAAASNAAKAADDSTLLVTTDMDCEWKLDGASQGRLKADDAKVVSIAQGKHLVQAASVDGRDSWKSVVNISKEGQEVVEITLKVVQGERLRAEQQKKDAAEDTKPTWTDPDSDLMWTKRDNGANVSWNQAWQYCADLSNSHYGKYPGWRMPTIEELARMYDPLVEFKGSHIKGRIQLSGWVWSSTGDGAGGAWGFVFLDGERASGPLEFSNAARALCVRRYKE